MVTYFKEEGNVYQFMQLWTLKNTFGNVTKLKTNTKSVNVCCSLLQGYRNLMLF